MGKAPLVPQGVTGGGATGPNPTDRGKRGTKRSVLTDGNGIPLAVAIDGANRHDSKLLAATLDGIVVLRPEPEGGEQHVCLDKGYDYAFVREEAEARGVRAPHQGAGRGALGAAPRREG